MNFTKLIFHRIPCKKIKAFFKITDISNAPLQIISSVGTSAIEVENEFLTDDEENCRIEESIKSQEMVIEDSIEIDDTVKIKEDISDRKQSIVLEECLKNVEEIKLNIEEISRDDISDPSKSSEKFDQLIPSTSLPLPKKIDISGKLQESAIKIKEELNDDFEANQNISMTEKETILQKNKSEEESESEIKIKEEVLDLDDDFEPNKSDTIIYPSKNILSEQRKEIQRVANRQVLKENDLKVSSKIIKIVKVIKKTGQNELLHISDKSKAIIRKPPEKSKLIYIFFYNIFLSFINQKVNRL